MSLQQASPADKQKLVQLAQSQRLEAAKTLGKKICKRHPGDAEAWFLLGAVYGQTGEFQDAETCCRNALKLQPGHAGLHYNLAVALLNQNKRVEAIASYIKSLQLNPDMAPAYNELAAIYLQQKHYGEAVTLLKTAVARIPGIPDLHLKLGIAYMEQGDLENALHACKHVLEIDPEQVDAIYTIGRIRRMQGQLHDALDNFEKALAARPDHAEILAVMGGTRKDMGKVEEGLVAFRKALALQPDRIDIHSSLLLNLNYTSTASPEEIFSEHCRWGMLHGDQHDISSSPGHSGDTDRRLRVGYVSPDFREHSVAYFFAPLLEKHNRENFEWYCYADLHLHTADATTERIKQLADHWRDITSLSDPDVKNLIQSDGIDILVDLAGHTAGNRLGVFAHRAAPVQISYLGYPNTSGLPTMDYRITDSWSDPEGKTDRFYLESLIRLPQGFLCYEAPKDAPEPAIAPVLSNGFITFGSFNNLAKVTPSMIQTWARLLNSVVDSRMILKNSSFRDAPTREYFYTMFQQAGVNRERLLLVPGTASLEAHLAAYDTVDIALDTSPYNGTTTTCEALWMGVPVITLKGATHASRVGFSLLSQIGLEELAAESTDNYLETAISLANDPDKLRQLRQSLRERMRSSSLCDAPGLARSIEGCYRQAWKKCCALNMKNG